MKKFSLIIILLLFITQISFGESESKILKIGLQYSSNIIEEKELVEISSSDGFEFGVLLSDEYIKEFEFRNLSTFAFKKDDYYHINLKSFSSYDEADKFMITNNIDGFIFKDSNYNVVIGNYNTLNDANSNLSSINSKYSVSSKVLYGDNLVLVLKNNKSVFGFDSNTGEYIISPLNSDLRDKVSFFGSISYRGGFGAKRLNTNDISIINYVRLNEYLYGVVPREMSSSWPIEALKAQAIVARNFALVNINKFSDYGFNLDNTVRSQVYGGYSFEGEVSNRAVDETADLSLKYGDIMVSAYYHSSSGGYTENSENVWSTEVGYLKGVFDPFSIGAPNANWTIEYTPSFIEEKLESKGYEIGTLNNFSISKYTTNNRVYEAYFSGSDGDVFLEKQTIRGIFGYNEIKSTLLTVHPDNEVMVTDGKSFYEKSPKELYVLDDSGKKTLISDTMVVYNGEMDVSVATTPTSYTINGSGWGHGLGMSQWGAKNMAELGFAFEEILSYYYTGTHIE